MNGLDEIKRAVAALPEAQRRELLLFLRGTLPPHQVEKQLHATAGELLEALARADELTIRMFRGVIAEAAFAVDVIPRLGGRWAERPTGRNAAYDFLMTDDDPPVPPDAPSFRKSLDVRVQVKMQRSKAGVPLLARSKQRTWPATYYVVEMQRTRTGEHNGERTRPYRFGEFDILAVSLGPSTERWSNFMYTVEHWLVPDPKNPSQIQTFQPVAPADDDVWTSDFETCVRWWRSGISKRIA